MIVCDTLHNIILNMTFAGTINNKLLTEVIKPAFNNFEDMSYDVSPAKRIMVDFICKNCKIAAMPKPAKNIDKYALSAMEPDGFCMRLRDNTKIQYLFSVTTGKVYVVASETSCIFASNTSMPFDIYLMAVTSSVEGRPKLLA